MNVLTCHSTAASAVEKDVCEFLILLLLVLYLFSFFSHVLIF